MNQAISARECISDLSQRSAWVLLTFLLVFDFAFVLLHAVNHLTDALDSPLWNVEKDGGYAEVFQYIKLSLVAALFLYLSRKHTFRFVTWALVFTYFLVDDSLQLHETIGGLITEDLDVDLGLGLRGKDYGELAVSAFFCVLLLVPLAWAYLNGAKMFKKVSQDVALLIIILVFFGVFVDMVHIVVHMGWKVRFLLGVIEDGGEMVALSLILWYVYLLKARGHNGKCYLVDLVRAVLHGRFA